MNQAKSFGRDRRRPTATAAGKTTSSSRTAIRTPAASPAPARLLREAGPGVSSRSMTVSASAAGPCCQAAWLATAHRSDPRAAAVAAGTAARPRPIRSRSRSSIAPDNAARTAIAFLEIREQPSSSSAVERSQPGRATSRNQTCGATRGVARIAGATG